MENHIVISKPFPIKIVLWMEQRLHDRFDIILQIVVKMLAL